MKQEQIIGWLKYLQNAQMVAVDEINAFDQVYQARKYCSCMRIGVFSPDLVTDLQIWRALVEMRKGCPEHGTLEYAPGGTCFTCEDSLITVARGR